MGLLSWIVVGAIAGWLSGQVMKGRGFGLLGDIIVGIVGGLIGGFLAEALPTTVNTRVRTRVSGLGTATAAARHPSRA